MHLFVYLFIYLIIVSWHSLALSSSSDETYSRPLALIYQSRRSTNAKHAKLESNTTDHQTQEEMQGSDEKKQIVWTRQSK
jgi:hypothetical protein